MEGDFGYKMVVQGGQVSQLVAHGDKVEMRYSSWGIKVITPKFIKKSTHLWNVVLH